MKIQLQVHFSERSSCKEHDVTYKSIYLHRGSPFHSTDERQCLKSVYSYLSPLIKINWRVTMSFLVIFSDFFFANVLIPISDTHKYSPTTSNDSKRQKEKHLRLFFFTFCGLWYKNSNNSLWSTDFNDPASRVCFVAWEEWEGSKAAGCPFWLPKTTINTYWEGQDCSHLPVNIMTVWKSSRSCEI